MKIFSALFLLSMLSLVSCGGKGGGGGNSGLSMNAYTTTDGYIDYTSKNLEIGSQVYTLQQVQMYPQNVNLITTAMMQRQPQPIPINGVLKYRINITAQLTNPYGMNVGGYNTGYTGGYNNGYTGGYAPGYTGGYTPGYPYTTSGSYGGAYGQQVLVIQSIRFY